LAPFTLRVSGWLPASSVSGCRTDYDHITDNKRRRPPGIRLDDEVLVLPQIHLAARAEVVIPAAGQRV